MKMTKQEAGALGGKRTVALHGKSYMAEIGARGAKTTWSRYRLVPFGVNNFAMVDRITNETVAYFAPVQGMPRAEVLNA